MRFWACSFLANLVFLGCPEILEYNEFAAKASNLSSHPSPILMSPEEQFPLLLKLRCSSIAELYSSALPALVAGVCSAGDKVAPDSNALLLLPTQVALVLLPFPKLHTLCP